MLLPSPNRIIIQAHIKHKVVNMLQEVGLSLIRERSECDMSEWKNMEVIWTLSGTKFWFVLAGRSMHITPAATQNAKHRSCTLKEKYIHLLVLNILSYKIKLYLCEYKETFFSVWTFQANVIACLI